MAGWMIRSLSSDFRNAMDYFNKKQAENNQMEQAEIEQKEQLKELHESIPFLKKLEDKVKPENILIGGSQIVRITTQSDSSKFQSSATDIFVSIQLPFEKNMMMSIDEYPSSKQVCDQIISEVREQTVEIINTINIEDPRNIRCSVSWNTIDMLSNGMLSNGIMFVEGREFNKAVCGTLKYNDPEIGEFKFIMVSPGLCGFNGENKLSDWYKSVSDIPVFYHKGKIHFIGNRLQEYQFREFREFPFNGPTPSHPERVNKYEERGFTQGHMHATYFFTI